MTIQLIKGEFPQNDAAELVSQVIQSKIKFHEEKIHSDMSEEDIKYREQKIKKLQTDLHNVRKYIAENSQRIAIESQIELN